MSCPPIIPEEEISFSQAWTTLNGFDWEDARIEDLIAGLGTSLPGYFKQKFRGGIDVQQVPSEIASLIRYFWKTHPRMNSYLEVGIGKGGTFMLLNESWRARGINPSLFVADNFSYAHAEQQERFEWVRERYQPEAYLGNTASREFETFLSGKNFEVIFIDGDHSFEGCLGDFLATYPTLQKNGSMIFHDIASCPGVRDVFNFAKGYFRASETFVDSASCGIGVLREPCETVISTRAILQLKLCCRLSAFEKFRARLAAGLARRLRRGWAK